MILCVWPLQQKEGGKSNIVVFFPCHFLIVDFSIQPSAQYQTCSLNQSTDNLICLRVDLGVGRVHFSHTPTGLVGQKYTGSL